MSATVHLVPTREVFAAQVAEQFGSSAVLHPSNRITSCGRHMSGLSVTERPEWATCKTCQRKEAAR